MHLCPNHDCLRNFTCYSYNDGFFFYQLLKISEDIYSDSMAVFGHQKFIQLIVETTNSVEHCHG